MTYLLFLFLQSMAVGRGARKRVSAETTAIPQQEANNTFSLKIISYIFFRKFK